MNTTKTFQVRHLAKVAGVTVNMINTWVKRDVLRPERPRNSGWTAYTVGDLFRACACGVVSRLRIPPTQARFILNAIQEDLEQHLGAYADKSGQSDARGYVLAEGLHVPDAGDPRRPLLQQLPSLPARRVCLAELREIITEGSAVTRPQAAGVLAPTGYVMISTDKIWKRCEPLLLEAGVIDPVEAR